MTLKHFYNILATVYFISALHVRRVLTSHCVAYQLNSNGSLMGQRMTSVNHPKLWPIWPINPWPIVSNSHRCPPYLS